MERTVTTPIPESFKPLFRTSPFLDLIGPIYQSGDMGELIIGIRVGEKHCNARQGLHGGVISTLADIALGYNTAFSGEKPIPMSTANLSIDYVGGAALGDWISIHTDVQKIGRNLAFANCYFKVNEKRIARASAVFSVVQGK